MTGLPIYDAIVADRARHPPPSPSDYPDPDSPILSPEQPVALADDLASGMQAFLAQHRAELDDATHVNERAASSLTIQAALAVELSTASDELVADLINHLASLEASAGAMATATAQAADAIVAAAGAIPPQAVPAVPDPEPAGQVSGGGVA